MILMNGREGEHSRLMKQHMKKAGWCYQCLGAVSRIL